jgi:hypothetical protein
MTPVQFAPPQVPLTILLEAAQHTCDEHPCGYG